MEPNEQEVLFKRLSGTCVLFVPFLLLLSILAASEAVTGAQLTNSDPLVRLFGYPLATAVTLLLGASACLYWIYQSGLTRECLTESAFWSVLGAGGALLILWVTALVFDHRLPSFVPPEESAESGLVLGLTAGMFEEIVFRLIALPAILMMLCRKLSFNLSALITSFAVGLLFAASHQLSGDPFVMEYFLTRLIIPGFIMSMIFIKFHPALLVSGHSAAHIGIALLFTSAG